MEYINALPAGTMLEEYEIHTVLGRGGFGITYLAEDIKVHKHWAIKEYLPDGIAARTTDHTVVPNSSAHTADYRWGLGEFLKEARTLALFDHPHVNKVARYIEANGTAYMVLEYIDGQTLSTLLDKYTTVPDAHLQRIIREVLSGLEEVHAAGYVHRDIKPSNMMLRRDGSVVLLDFGAARQAVGLRSKSITAILTPPYAPVEQYATKAEDVGPWSDLYALGMVAYRCISGLPSENLPDSVTRDRTQRRGGQDMTPAAEVGKGAYDAQFLEAIDWAIQVDEKDRPQSIAEWRKAFPGDQLLPPGSPPDDDTSEQRGADSIDTGKKEVGREQGQGNNKRKYPVSKIVLAMAGVVILGAVLWRLVPLPGSGDIRTDWERAQRINTPEAYQQFLSRHPTGPLAELAKARLAEPDLVPEPAGIRTDWERAQRINTPEAYQQFLSRHPTGPLAELAKARLAEFE